MTMWKPLTWSRRLLSSTSWVKCRLGECSPRLSELAPVERAAVAVKDLGGARGERAVE